MMLCGADYYPELWPRAQWPRDLDLMAEAGLTVVRVGDLCWASMEPAPGRYTFDWLDEVLALLRERGMSAVLATPTAAPPPWLVQEDPTVMPVDAQGWRTAYGSWGAHCLSSPALRERTRGIVRAMAERYGHHPAVAGWQIDNELNVHGTPCHCERCTTGFQAWLRERYGGLDALNAAWGTACWSHIYTAWEQVPAPVETLAVYVHNPGLRLDFRRFASDQAIGYYQLQAEIIRAATSRSTSWDSTRTSDRGAMRTSAATGSSWRPRRTWPMPRWPSAWTPTWPVVVCFWSRCVRAARGRRTCGRRNRCPGRCAPCSA